MFKNNSKTPPSSGIRKVLQWGTVARKFSKKESQPPPSQGFIRALKDFDNYNKISAEKNIHTQMSLEI